MPFIVFSLSGFVFYVVAGYFYQFLSTNFKSAFMMEPMSYRKKFSVKKFADINFKTNRWTK